MDIYFNALHDITLDGGDLRFTATAAEDVKQRLTIRLQFLLAEWFLDTSVGIPYTQAIFEPSTEEEQIYLFFRDEINNTEGVEIINNLDLVISRDERMLAITVEVNNGVTVEVTT